jgi:hypothetical protein
MHLSEELIGRELLDLDQVGTHTGHECYGDVDEVDGCPGQEDVETDEIAPSDAFRCPRTVVVILSDADPTIIAVAAVPRDHHFTFGAFLFLVFGEVSSRLGDYSWVAGSHEQVGERMANANEERDHLEVDVVGGGVDQFDDKVTDHAEGDEGGQEA